MLHRDRIALIAALAVFTVVALAACRGSDPGQQAPRSVTIYVSTDRVFSEPVLRAYERQSGVTVNAVYDTEETKSTGLANRLLAEQARPQADVFWSNEPVVPWCSSRVTPSRRTVPRTPKASRRFSSMPTAIGRAFRRAFASSPTTPHSSRPTDAPTSVFDLADPRWRGQVAIANPRFGSTSFHVAALYAAAGDERMDAFFRQLKANDVKIVDGNSVVRDLVSRGEVKIGLTDTDDVNVAIEDGQPIAMVLPDAAGLGVPVMPNMVSLVANAPHVEEGQRLIDYLLSRDVEEQLARSAAVQIPLHAGVPGPKNIPAIDTFRPMTLDFTKAAQRVEEVTGRLAGILGL